MAENIYSEIMEQSPKATGSLVRMRSVITGSKSILYPPRSSVTFPNLVRITGGNQVTAVKSIMVFLLTLSFVFLFAPIVFAGETRGEAASLKPRSPGTLDWDRYSWAEAITWFARGMGAVRTGDLAAAKKAETRMAELREHAKKLGEPAWVNYIDIDRLILAGWLTWKEGKTERSIALIRSSTELDKTVEKDPVTPGALFPPYEALGDLFLEIGRPAEALEAYELSLRVWPRRFNTLLGAARAARKAGDVEKAKAHYTELLNIVRGAETDRPGVYEARQFLADNRA